MLRFRRNVMWNSHFCSFMCFLCVFMFSFYACKNITTCYLFNDLPFHVHTETHAYLPIGPPTKPSFKWIIHTSTYVRTLCTPKEASNQKLRKKTCISSSIKNTRGQDGTEQLIRLADVLALAHRWISKGRCCLAQKITFSPLCLIRAHRLTSHLQGPTMPHPTPFYSLSQPCSLLSSLPFPSDGLVYLPLPFSEHKNYPDLFSNLPRCI